MRNRVTDKKFVEIYVNFLFEATSAWNETELLVLYNQIRDIKNIFRKEKDFVDVLINKNTSNKEREKLLSIVIPDILPILSGVLLELCNRVQIELISEIFYCLETKIENELNISFVELITCVPVDDKLREKIRSKCQNDLGKNVLLSECINKDILGGLILNYKSKILDASLVTKLESLRSRLVKANDGGK